MHEVAPVQSSVDIGDSEIGYLHYMWGGRPPNYASRRLFQPMAMAVLCWDGH